MNKQQLNTYNFVTTNLAKFTELIEPIRAVGLSGSYARGDEDSLSDIDSCVFVAGELPSSKIRQQVYSKLGFQDYIYQDVDFEYSRGDGFLVNNVRCDFNWMSIEVIQLFLQNLERDFESPEFIPGGLATVKALYDPKNVIHDLQAAIPFYSEARAQHRIRKTINEAYFSLYELGWLEKAVHRQDYFLFLKYQYHLLDSLVIVLFALNQTWLSDEKGLIKRLASFSYGPSRIEKRIQEIIMHRQDNKHLHFSLSNLKKLFAETVESIHLQYSELNLPRKWP